MKNTNYYAFISYSRKDKGVANWLHTKLEKYPYPKKLVKPENAPADKRLVRPIFIDVEDLAMSERKFSDDIKGALENSKYLILLCSKNSAQSTYVDKEVKYFLKTHGNDYAKIVPLFIDCVDESIPPSILDTSVMERHFPIYDSSLSPKSEANKYCFYQIASYLLGVEFSVLYNRYEKYARRKKRKGELRIGILLAFMAAIIVLQKISSDRQKELIDFEKKVYPQSIVVGYEKNFLSPVIDYLKRQDDDFKVMILMPTNEVEIDQRQGKVKDMERLFANEIGADSLGFVKLPTAMKRGSNITVINDKDSVFKDVYIDFATTTYSFKGVAEYKKKHKAYKQTDINKLINEYAETFIQETKQELGGDSVYVEFYTSNKCLINRLKEYREQKTH